MNRRDFMQTMTATGTLAAMPALAKARKRPNLLFVFSDQHAYDMLGCNGHDQVKTPHLDAFSRQSLNLDSCFSVSPLCTPMRGSLLSGLHPLHNGAYDNNVRMLEGNGTYFAEVLRQNGYQTAYVGKWHLYGGYWYQPVPAGPYRYGFDDVFLSNNCDLNYQPENAFYYDQDSGEKIKFNEWEQFGQTRQACRVLDSVDDDRPWALFVSWHPPHNHKTRKPEDYYAYSAPRKYLDLYDYDQVQVREGTTPTEQNRRMMHGYMSLVSSVDDCFGELMKTLKQQGLDDNTIVVYTADHGDMLKVEDGNVFVKSRAESASSQVPFIIRWPEHFQPGTRSDLLFGTLDIMPTLLSLTGIQPPQTCHGRDLSAALKSGDTQTQESVPMMMSSLDQWRGIATRDWIYSYNPYEPKHMGDRTYNVLYNRHDDPGCLKNLFNDPGFQSVQQELHRKTQEWMARFDDPFMPYGALRDATLDSADLGNKGYVDFWKKSSTGILRTRPIDAAKQW
ncbi:MAG: sulfatase, partial [Verrucomicrobiota bacterium]|nr:sulfatase [Verrucomicrobiota bacterium]